MTAHHHDPASPQQTADSEPWAIGDRGRGGLGKPPEDRAKAQSFIERSAIKILAGPPPRELNPFNDVIKLSGTERALVASWAAPEAWFAGSMLPGRDTYLIMTGERNGLPVSLTLVAEEWELYDTDAAIRQVQP